MLSSHWATCIISFKASRSQDAGNLRQVRISLAASETSSMLCAQLHKSMVIRGRNRQAKTSSSLQRSMIRLPRVWSSSQAILLKCRSLLTSSSVRSKSRSQTSNTSASVRSWQGKTHWRLPTSLRFPILKTWWSLLRPTATLSYLTSLMVDSKTLLHLQLCNWSTHLSLPKSLQSQIHTLTSCTQTMMISGP